MTENNKNIDIDTVYAEAKQMPDQIPVKSESVYERDIRNFMRVESKKYKRTDNIEDLIDRD